MPHYETSYK